MHTRTATRGVSKESITPGEKKHRGGKGKNEVSKVAMGEKGGVEGGERWLRGAV